jgi:nicotinamide mononucleotide transporter
MWIWLAHYNRETAEVETRKLSKLGIIKIVGSMIIAIVFLNAALSMTDDTQPLLDSVTTVPAFIGQILLTYRYREQWIFWFIIDVGSIIMWLIAGDYCMAAQFIFWSFNCIYGFYLWSKR